MQISVIIYIEIENTSKIKKEMIILRKKTPEQLLSGYGKEIISEQRKWIETNENGCNDPFWTDGCNMNLIRNHILYAKEKISEICEEYNISYPEEYYIPTPPKVDNNYMANLKQKDRIERLTVNGKKIVTHKVKYNMNQLSFL